MIKPKTMRWTRHMACMGDRKGAYRVLVGRPDGKKSLGRPRYRWEINIKMDLQEVEWGVMDRWQELVNVVINPQGPKNAGNF
jgi:hypothetical protein